MNNNEINTTEYFFAGGFGGFCAVLSGHPIDTVKVRLQTMQKPTFGKQPLYTGAVDSARKIFVTEGFYGFYKGLSAPLLSVTPLAALSFFGYAVGKKLQQTEPKQSLTELQMFCAGGFSGLCTTILVTPVERIKCLIQIQRTGPKLYNGMIDCLRKLYKSGGIVTIYRGIWATALRDIPGNAIYYMTYEGLKRRISRGNELSNLSTTVFAGGMAGVLSWSVIIPADVLKSIYQTAPDGIYPRGIRSVFKEIMRTEGISGFYKGAAPTLIRGFVANAACFVGYETFVLFMRLFKNK